MGDRPSLLVLVGNFKVSAVRLGLEEGIVEPVDTNCR